MICMDYEKIRDRIQELEEIKSTMDDLASEKRLELAQKEAEAREIKEQINRNIFINTEEHKELQELKITRKWLDIYNNKDKE